MSDPVLDALATRAKGAEPDTDDDDPVLKSLNERAGGKQFEIPKSAPAKQGWWSAAATSARAAAKDYVGKGETVANVVTGGVGALAGGLNFLGTLAATKGDVNAASAVQEATQEKLTYAPRTEAGQHYASDVAEAMSWLGPKQGEWAGPRVAELTGSPAAGAVVNTAIQGAPMLIGLRGAKAGPKGAAKAGSAESVTAEAISPQSAPQVAIVRESVPEPTPQASPRAPIEPPQAARASQKDGTSPDLNVPEGDLLKFEEVPATAPKGTHPTAEQARRRDVLQRIGLDEVRQSAITGDAKAAATEFQMSKLDNAPGNMFRRVLDKEREALGTFGEGLVRETGGSVGVDQTALHSRGSTIIEPMDGLRSYFDAQTSKLYKIADERAGATAIETPEVHKLISGDQADFLGTVEGEALLRGTKARMKSLGMFDEQGAIQPVTVMQVERLKQYLGEQWQPRTARLIRRLKDALDDDVTKAAGADVYKEARAMRAQRARILDDPKGIARLMDSSGPEGINRAVPTEKIPDTVVSMPVAQFEHVVATLRNMPDDLQPQAQAALAEIKAQFANRVYEAGSRTQGQWNAKGVTQYLANNAARMTKLFTPEEMQSFRDLNDAGHILKKDQSYPGAAVQEHNLLKAGAMGGIRAAATGAGSALGGAPGAMLGGIIGDRVATGFSDKSALRSAQKRVVKLSDLAKPSQ